MRITFVLPYAGMAGGIRVIAIYADRLRRRGHEVSIVSTPWIPPGRRGKAWAVVRRWLHRVNPRSNGPLDPSHLDGLDIPHRHLSEARAVTDADVPDADVVIATWWETAPWVAGLSASKGAKAYFVQDYGAHEGQPMTAVAQTWKLPLHKIAISKWLMGLVDQYCESPDVDYVPNAVDHERFFAVPRGKQSQPTVGFLYNRAPQKGCDMMLKAIELASANVRNLLVVAYGPGDPDADLPMPAGSQYWKFAPDEKLKDIYASCDAWLFGSRSEGFGLPILEAMACRTPVIATPAGAAPELLEGGGGILVEPEDPRSMADAIERVAAMPEHEWKSMSDAACATASGYTWDDATSLFETALHRAIDKQTTEAQRRRE